MTVSADTRLVVVGASLAGLRAVEAARRAGHEGPITLIGAEDHLPYDRPPLSKQFFDPAEEPAETQFRAHEHFADLNVEVLLGSPATALDPQAQTVAVADGTVVPYDRLIVTTGVRARELPGADLPDLVVGLRTVDDARAIRAALDAQKRIVIVGCGFIGSEVASAMWKRGLPTTLIEMAPVPLARAVGERVGGYFADLHRQHGIDLRLGTTVQAVERVGDAAQLTLDDGTVLEADLVVLGLGANPATDWLAGSGIELAPDGSILADATLRTSLPGVYAAGDVVTWSNDLFDRSMRLEHWTSAAEQAAVAVRNALAEEAAETYETVPYFWSDLYGKRIQFVGVHGTGKQGAGREDADDITLIEAGEARVWLYRDGERLSAALLVDQPRLTMKLRKIIAERGPFEDGLELVNAAQAKLAAAGG